MLTYSFCGDPCQVGDEGHVHQAGVFNRDGKQVASFVIVKYPDESTHVRVFDYDVKEEEPIRQLMSKFDEVTFSRPM